MKRIALLITLAITVATLALSTSPALAQTKPPKPVTLPPMGGGGGGGGGETLPAGCTRDGGQVTCVTERTFTQEETRQLAQRTESRETPAVAPCTVGNSDRVGTQEGIQTDEVLITTFGVFEVTFKETTTTVFQGNPTAGNVVSGPTQMTEKVSERELRRFETEEVVNTTFEPTGRCENVPGPQNEEAVENANPQALEPRPRGNQPTEELPVETPVDEPRGNRPADTPRGNQPIDLPRGGQPEDRLDEVLPVERLRDELPEEVDEL